jgi:hypothetical protein
MGPTMPGPIVSDTGTPQRFTAAKDRRATGPICLPTGWTRARLRGHEPGPPIHAPVDRGRRPAPGPTTFAATGPPGAPHDAERPPHRRSSTIGSNNDGKPPGSPTGSPPNATTSTALRPPPTSAEPTSGGNSFGAVWQIRRP